MHDSLPTNSLRAHRGMIPMSFCPRCDVSPEDSNHLFHVCSKAEEFWHCLRSISWFNESLDKPLLDWILSNAKSKASFHLDTQLPWSTVFIVSLWQIWKARNEKCFDNLETISSVCKKAVSIYAKEIF